MSKPDNLAPLYRRIAARIIPYLFVCYVVAMIDRNNIGFGKLQFMEDLGLDDVAYGSIAGIFFFGYVLFEIPSNYLLSRIGARKTLLRILVLWGIATSLMAFARSANSFYVLRFILGAAEAGFFPGVILYLSFWFPSHLRGRITSLFIVAIPVGGMIGSPLSGMVMQHLDGAFDLRGWQWLFLVEGPPAVLLGFLAMFVLADTPAKAPWLSPSERELLKSDLAADKAQMHKAPKDTFRAMLSNPQLYALVVVYCTVTCFNSASIWLPTLLQSVGVTSLAKIGWVSGLISVGTAVGVLLAGRSSDYFMERRWHLVALALLTLGCYALLPLVSHSVALTACLTALAAGGGYGVLTVFWTLPPSMLGERSAPVGIAFISSVGQLGGALSPVLIGWIKMTTGSLYSALAVPAAILFLSVSALIIFTGSFPQTTLKATNKSQLEPEAPSLS